MNETTYTCPECGTPDGYCDCILPLEHSVCWHQFGYVDFDGTRASNDCLQPAKLRIHHKPHDPYPQSEFTDTCLAHANELRSSIAEYVPYRETIAYQRETYDQAGRYQL